jgi:O-antigen/teichoic acid export membrane protein
MAAVSSARRLIVAAMARQFAGMLATIVTVPIIAHKLGADALGAWVLAISGAMLVQLSDLGLSTAVRRAILAGDDQRALRSLARAIKSAVMVGGLAIFVARFLIGEIDGVAGAEAVLWLLPLAAWLMAIALPLHSYVLSYGGVVGLAWTRVISCAVQVSLTLAALQWFEGLAAPALGVLAGALVELCFLIWMTSRIKPEIAHRAIIGNEWRSDMNDASAALVINAAVFATVRIDALVLARISPLAVVASYCIAGRVVDQSYVLAKQVSSGLLPLLRNQDERARTLEIGTTVLTGAVAPGMIALAILGAPLLSLWAGAAGATEIAMISVALLGLAAIAAAFGEMACSVLTHTASSAWSGAIPVSCGAIVNVVLTLCFAPSFGFWGAALGTLAGAFTTATYVWYRIIRSALADRALLAVLLRRLLLSTVVSASIACLCLALPETPIWALLGCGIVTLGGFGVALQFGRHRVNNSERSATSTWKKTPSANPIGA